MTELVFHIAYGLLSIRIMNHDSGTGLADLSITGLAAVAVSISLNHVQQVKSVWTCRQAQTPENCMPCRLPETPVFLGSSFWG
jgi:hypothetical protein